jgi:hypothetical protein
VPSWSRGLWRFDEGQAIAEAGELEYALHAGWSLDQSQFPFRRAGGRVGLEDEVQPRRVHERHVAQVEHDALAAGSDAPVDVVAEAVDRAEVDFSTWAHARAPRLWVGLDGQPRCALEIVTRRVRLVGRTRSGCGGQRGGVGLGGGEYEPHAGAIVVADTPASGQPIDHVQPEATMSGTRGTPADRAGTVVMDLHPHHAIHGGSPDVHRRAGGLTGVLDAVGDQLGYEQNSVLVKLGVPTTLKPKRDRPAREQWRLGSTRHRRLADLYEGSCSI